MKQYYYFSILTFFIGSIFTYTILYNQNKVARSATQQNGSTYEDNCGDPVDHNCMERTDKRNSFMNDLTARAFSIEKNSSGKTIATINFPAFSDQSEDKQKDILELIKKSEATTLVV